MICGHSSEFFCELLTQDLLCKEDIIFLSERARRVSSTKMENAGLDERRRAPLLVLCGYTIFPGKKRGFIFRVRLHIAQQKL